MYGLGLKCSPDHIGNLSFHQHYVQHHYLLLRVLFEHILRLLVFVLRSMLKVLVLYHLLYVLQL